MFLFVVLKFNFIGVLLIGVLLLYNYICVMLKCWKLYGFFVKFLVIVLEDIKVM